jgi:hypothetical protein
MQSTKYSDYELTSALNDAVKMLWITFAEHYSTIPRKTVRVTLTQGSAPLPEDYYSLVEISGNAWIDGLRVRGHDRRVRITYNCIPPSVAGAEEEVAVEAVALDLTEIAAAIAQGETSIAVQIAESTAKRISQKREYAAIPDRRPFS